MANANQQNPRYGGPLLPGVEVLPATREQEPMTVFLVNGVMLQGEVLAFNRFSMLLGRRGQLQLIYKHAVSTMQPGRQLSLGNGDDEEGAA